MVLQILFWLAAAVWLALTITETRTALATPDLPVLDVHAQKNALTPTVSVVIAARNEIHRIGATVERLLAQRHIDFEIIVADDRSTDGASALLDELAQRHERLRVIHIQTLPERWLGKCHALQQGAADANGEWILFCDADIWLAPNVLARVVQTAQNEHADHVTLIPTQPESTPGAKVGIANMLLAVGDRCLKVNRDRKHAFVGVGAFNMVRTECYRAIGGHEPLRLEVVDDMKLGLLLSRAGFRSRGYFAGADATMHYAPTMLGFLKALEKNMYAWIGYRWWIASGICAVYAILLSLSIIGVFSGTLAGVAAFAALLSTIIPVAIAMRRCGWSIWNALLTPLTFVLAPAIVANSALRTQLAGGIRWRDTFYPLPLLREGLVR